MHQINEFNNSALAKSIVADRQDVSDRKITLIVTGILVVLAIVAFKHAIGN